MIQFDEHIFQMGWNHQQEKDAICWCLEGSDERSWGYPPGN